MTTRARDIIIPWRKLEEAIELLTASKPPKLSAPLNEVLKNAEMNGLLRMKELICALLKAGYEINDIRQFLEYASILEDSKEWATFRDDIVYAWLECMAKVQRGEE